MKIKVKETKTTEKEVDIEFPYYVSNGYLYIKYLNETTAICVSFGYLEKSYEISKSDRGFPDNWILFPKISEEEFNKKLDMAIELVLKEQKKEQKKEQQ